MVAWRPPPSASSTSPTASVGSAVSPCGSRSTSPSASHGRKHHHLAGQHSHQQHAPLSPPLSRPLSPVLILPHSAAIRTATYHPHRDVVKSSSQVGLPATPPASPPSYVIRPSSLVSDADAAGEAETEDRLVDSPLTASPRPSLRRLDTPVYVSPRDPDVSEAVLRGGAWVGMTAAATRQQAEGRRQATI